MNPNTYFYPIMQPIQSMGAIQAMPAIQGMQPIGQYVVGSGFNKNRFSWQQKE